MWVGVKFVLIIMLEIEVGWETRNFSEAWAIIEQNYADFIMPVILFEKCPPMKKFFWSNNNHSVEESQWSYFRIVNKLLLKSYSLIGIGVEGEIFNSIKVLDKWVFEGVMVIAKYRCSCQSIFLVGKDPTLRAPSILEVLYVLFV